MDGEPARGIAPLLRSRAFFLLQARGTSAGVGYTVYLATVLWLSYRLTHGVLLAGIAIGVETVVYTFTFLTGPIVDRIHDKRWVYLLCYPIQAVAALALGVTYMAGLLTVPLLLALVVVLAVLWDFTWAADAASTRILFGKDQLFAVSGLGTAIGGGVDIVLYLTAGVTIAFFGAAGGSYLYAALLAGAAGFAVLLPIVTPARPTERYLASFREGWALYRGEAGRPLRHLAVLQFVYGFFVSAPLLVLTLYVARDFAGSQSTYAALYVAYLIGGISIGLVLGALNPRRYLGPVAIATLAATSVALISAELVAGSVLLSLGAWLGVGLAMTARVTTFSNYMQGRFAPEVLARIAGNNYLFPGISGAAGAFTIGSLSTVWGPTALTDLIAVGFATSAGLAMLLPEIRSLGY
ncbi:MAG: MFS transporter [Thermoplasmata archaeon]